MALHQTRYLYEAALTLAAFGRATTPQIEIENGTQRQRPPLLRLPAETLGLRFALNRNALRGIAEVYEEKLKELADTHNLKDGAPIKTDDERKEFSARTARYNKAVEKLGREEVEWSSPAVIRAKQLGEREIPDAWLAALLAVGIIVMDEQPEKPRDAKKKKDQLAEAQPS